MHRIILIFAQILICILFAGGMVLQSNEAFATSVIELSDAQLVEMSSEIVHGTVLEVQSVQSGNQILSRVTLEVTTWLKPVDQTSKRFDFYLRGGQLGDFRQVVSGEMTVHVGEEVVVFLERIPKYGNLPMPLGLQQAAFYVEPNPEADRCSLDRPDKKVVQRINGLSIVSRHQQEPSSFRSAKTLDNLIHSIRARIALEVRP